MIAKLTTAEKDRLLTLLGTNESLQYFIPRITPRWESPRHLKKLTDLFERIMRGEAVRALVSVPPQFGKTEVELHAIAWLLRARPELPIAFVGYSAEFSRGKSRLARSYAVEAGVQLVDDSKSMQAWLTPDGGGLRATSIGGPLTGNPVKVALVDDPHKDRAEAESGLSRERVHEWFHSTLIQRLHPGGSIVVVHTRWHPEDLIGHLLASNDPSDPDGMWEHINLPALNEDGESLWESKRPAEFLRRRRVDIGEYNWASLYMGQPRPRGANVFGDTHFFDALPEGYRVTIGVDFAYTAKTYADFSVAVVLARKGDTCFVLDVVRAQVKPEDFAKHIQNLAATYKGARFESYVSTTEQGITSLLRQLGGVPIHGRLAKADKFVRAQPVAAAWNAGRVLIPSAKYLAGKKADWLDAFVAEVCGFTGVKDRYDDQVDALASAFDASAVSSAPTRGGISKAIAFDDAGTGL